MDLAFCRPSARQCWTVHLLPNRASACCNHLIQRPLISSIINAGRSRLVQDTFFRRSNAFFPSTTDSAIAALGRA